MDFVRLGAIGATTYTPDVLIEGYSSLIWTERQQELGSFELKTTDIQRIGDLLPPLTLVSHLETLEVMEVETHSIEMVGEGADAYPELTISGRSATLILEHRWVEGQYQKKRRMRRAYSATSAACVLMWQAVDNNTGADVTRGDSVKGGEPGNSYAWTTLDDIPNVIVTENVASEGAAHWYQLEQGMLMPQLKEIVKSQDLGFRCLRPVLPNSHTVIGVYSTLSRRGEVSRTVYNNIEALQFQVYDGVDRSATVQMSLLQGHVVSPQYLTSIAEWDTVVELMSDVVEVADTYRTGESALSGWSRRTIGMDAGSPELDAAPTRPTRPSWNSATAAQKRNYYTAMDNYYDKRAAWNTKRNADIAAFRTAQTAAAQTLLKDHAKINMFAGDISDLSPYKYKTHYDLGDTITLFGDYGKSAKMVVREYVRTEDASGDRGFPGLSAP